MRNSIEPTKYITIDDEGFFHFNQIRVTDEDFGKFLIDHLYLDEKGRYLTKADSEWVWVENFDEPLVVQQILKTTNNGLNLLLPYQAQCEADFDRLTLDEWDRFHGVDKKGRSFVFSRKAQAAFFDSLDEFDDETFTIHGQKYTPANHLGDEPHVDDSSFWTQHYQCNQTPWDLNEPSPILADVAPQLKLTKCRVAVLGAGSAQDAEFFRKQGHLVTAFDYSEAAILQAKAAFPELNYVQQDVFKLSPEYFGQFDIVFEHTLYCAINPQKRNELKKQWLKLLDDQGHLLGIFLTIDKHKGPPFGSTEWELRERLKKSFDFRYWTRWKNSHPHRHAKELVVFAKKKDN